MSAPVLATIACLACLTFLLVTYLITGLTRRFTPITGAFDGPCLDCDTPLHFPFRARLNRRSVSRLTLTAVCPACGLTNRIPGSVLADGLATQGVFS